jgi:Flp pilus assembly protein TadG
LRRLVEPWGPTTAGQERGAVSVLVALLMVVILGFAALAVDVALVYSERAQLQNGADAAALGVAQICAMDPSDSQCAIDSSRAKELANNNAMDGASNVKSIALDKLARKVTVSTGAKESGIADNSISLVFANALGVPTAEVSAQSSAAWGTPSKGRIILPLAIAECKFNLALSGLESAPQLLQMKGGECGGLPGGFGWIQGTSSTTCGITVSAGTSSNSGVWFSSDTGANVPSVCGSSDIEAMKDQTVLLPLYDLATGVGSSGKYYIKAFAAFHITGYQFPSHLWWPADGSGISSCNKCLRGKFVKLVSLDSAFELGSGTSYGATIVRLTP